MNGKWVFVFIAGFVSAVLLYLVILGFNDGICPCAHPQGILQANNQLLRDHITGMGVWVTITTVAFTLLTAALPMIWERKTKDLEQRVQVFENDIERGRQEITMLHETSVFLFLEQLVSQMHIVTPVNLEEPRVKNLVVIILNIFERLPFCSRETQKITIKNITDVFDFWANESNKLGRDCVKNWIASIMTPPRKFPVSHQAFLTDFADDSETLNNLRAIFEYFGLEK